MRFPRFSEKYRQVETAFLYKTKITGSVETTVPVISSFQPNVANLFNRTPCFSPKWEHADKTGSNPAIILHPFIKTDGFLGFKNHYCKYFSIM